MSIFLLVLGLVIFVGLVVIHELGHFVAARRSGVEVEEFGIGLPPRAKIVAKKKGTIFSLNWLPLGGFVRLKGELDSDTTKGSYGAASLKNKTIIMVAGVVMNLITAIILFTILALIGMPKLIDNQFSVKSDSREVQHRVLAGFVQPDSPAAAAGLRLEDELISIKDANSGEQLLIKDPQSLQGITKRLAGQKTQLTVNRLGNEQQLDIQLRSTEEVEASKKTDSPKPYLGVAPTEYIITRSTWSAPIVAVGLTKQITVLTFQSLSAVLSGLFHGSTAKASESVTGPVGIFVLIKNGSLLGYEFILMIMGVISLTLAIMNILPIPALDGGRLFVTYLFRGLNKIGILFKKRFVLTRRWEEAIHGSGFVALLLLFVLITIVDVRRFF